MKTINEFLQEFKEYYAKVGYEGRATILNGIMDIILTENIQKDREYIRKKIQQGQLKTKKALTNFTKRKVEKMMSPKNLLHTKRIIYDIMEREHFKIWSEEIKKTGRD